MVTLVARDVSFGHSSRALLFAGVSFRLEPGFHGLVGENGSGKSTLLALIAGRVEPEEGALRTVPSGARLATCPQEDGPLDAEVRDFAAATHAHAASLRGRLQLDHAALSRWESLSPGERKRWQVGAALAREPDVLLLDEPTNHLDLPAIEWLEAELKASRGAIVLISHDRRFLENLSRATVWIDRGKARRLEQGFAAFEDWRDKVLEEEEIERHKLDRKIVREDQWMHGGVTGRRKRNVRRVRELRSMRREVSEQRQATGNVRLELAEGGTSGRLVAEATKISKSFGGRQIVKDLSLRIMRGDRLGLVGPNGAGKTTLIKLLTGALEPDSGGIRLGTNLELVALDQRRDELDPNWTVAEALTGGRGDQVVINGKARHVASYMKDFLFQPEQRRTPLRVLSGGERARLMLARALAKPSNLLILDEPTNDLDLETLDLLQELLADYPGTVLLVSHDRDFLDRVVTSVLAPEGDGRWTEYPGGYSDMLIQRKGAEPQKVAGASIAGVRTEPVSDGGAVIERTAQAQRKLSFKDKHALETLPKTIAKLESDIANLGMRLADPRLYSKDRPAFDKATAELAAAQASLEAAEMQWLELDERRAALEGT
jgi:ATP-binding cassette subfamily F protein uup